MDLRKRHNPLLLSPVDKSDLQQNSVTDSVTDDVTGGKGKTSQRRTSRYVYAGFSFLILSLITTFFYPKTLDNLFGVVWSARNYAIIIDSGSTGSRLLAFTFRRGAIDQQLQLVDELWEEVKPGLSSYAEDPKSAAESISKLLHAAKRHIPEEQWATTPITLKATAGLRLLPAIQAEAIIDEVEKVLLYSGFKLEKTLVEIMNPRDEGLYAWFTVNFLLDIFSKSLMESFVSLDLGGGSTQITFAPAEYPIGGLEGRKHFLHNVTILGDRQEVYTHSYLGLGLMAAREAIFTQGLEVTDKSLRSPCMASTTPQPWSFHGNDYVISSLPEQTSYEACQEIVRKVIQAQNVHVPSEIHSRKVAAFSYFYDRALDNGIVVPGQTEGRALIQSFIDAARLACRVGNHDDDTGFQCIDLTYIVSLLVDGYGLPPTKELHLFKKINGHEASWALGVAYSIVERK